MITNRKAMAKIQAMAMTFEEAKTEAMMAMARVEEKACEMARAETLLALASPMELAEATPIAQAATRAWGIAVNWAEWKTLVLHAAAGLDIKLPVQSIYSPRWKQAYEAAVWTNNPENHLRV